MSDDAVPTAPAPPPGGMIVAHGLEARVELANGMVRIRGEGLLGHLMAVIGHGDTLADKSIPVRMISSVEITRTFILGLISFETLRFSYAGSPAPGESRLRDTLLENVVIMGLFDNRDFYALKEAIEREMVALHYYGAVAPQAGPPPFVPTPEASPPAPPVPSPAWSERAGAWLARTSRGVPRRWTGATVFALLAALGLGWILFGRSSPPHVATTPNIRLTDSLFPSLSGSGQRQITWEAGPGITYRASVRARAVDEFQAFNRAWGEGLRQRLEARFRERLTVEMSPVFVEVDRRIPEYGEWVFNWWTSYILMVKGMGAIVTQVADGSEQTLQEVSERVMADAIKQRYIEIVLSPERFRPALRQAVTRAAAETVQELGAACEEMRGRFVTLLSEHGHDIELRTAAGGWLADRGWQARLTRDSYCAAPGVHVRGAVAALDASTPTTFGATGGIDEVAIRITRPFVTTMVSAGLSASSLAGLATAIGIPAALVATPAMAAVLTKSAFTLVDLMLSELDEALNRTTFEATVHDAVTRARGEFERDAAGTLRRALEQEFADMGLRPQAGL